MNKNPKLLERGRLERNEPLKGTCRHCPRALLQFNSVRLCPYCDFPQRKYEPKPKER